MPSNTLPRYTVNSLEVASAPAIEQKNKSPSFHVLTYPVVSKERLHRLVGARLEVDEHVVHAGGLDSRKTVPLRESRSVKEDAVGLGEKVLGNGKRTPEWEGGVY